MTTTQTDFEQLFRACYSGEAPWIALADWLLETGHRGEAWAFEEGREYLGGVFVLKVSLSLLVPAGQPGRIACYLNLPQFASQQEITLSSEVFCAGFPAWIANEVELLRLYLWRRGYLKKLT